MSTSLSKYSKEELEQKTKKFLNENKLVKCPKEITSNPYIVIMVHDSSALIVSEANNKLTLVLLTIMFSKEKGVFRGLVPVCVVETNQKKLSQYSTILAKIGFEYSRLEREHEIYNNKLTTGQTWYVDTPQGNLKYRVYPKYKKFSLNYLNNVYNKIKQVNDKTETANLNITEKQKLLKKDYTGLIDIVRKQINEEQVNSLIKKEIISNDSDVSTAEIIEKISSENPELFA